MLWALCLVSESAAQPTGSVPWVTQEVRAKGVSFHTFESRAAKTRVSFHLFSPEEYQSNSDRRYPVVYWLHGSGGGTNGIAKLSDRFNSAVKSGAVPPLLVVFVNGLPNGMYVDWKSGAAPLEEVIVKDLVPHVDASFRTIPDRNGRLLDGFSMGGYGTARLGFKFPDLFRAVSIIGAGPMQKDLLDAPLAGRARASQLLKTVYGGDKDHFFAVSPLNLAEQNAAKLKKNSLIRVVVGDQDPTLPANTAFHSHLTSLEIPHSWTVLPNVGHDPLGVLTAMGDKNWEFYKAAFAEDKTID